MRLTGGYARADLLPSSPLGRQFLAGYLGFGHGHTLFEQLGPGQVPGTAPLTAGGAAGSAVPGMGRLALLAGSAVERGSRSAQCML